MTAVSTSPPTSSSAPIDISPDPTSTTQEHIFDPLPDEAVLKAGWLLKKGRRGVACPFSHETHV